MSFTVWHWIVVVVLFLLLLGGRGWISKLAGEFINNLAGLMDNFAQDVNYKGPDILFVILVGLALFLAFLLVMVAMFS